MDSYPALLEIIKSSLGRKLETEGVESIAKILNKDDGFELIGYMFPNMRKDLFEFEMIYSSLKSKYYETGDIIYIWFQYYYL